MGARAQGICARIERLAASAHLSQRRDGGCRHGPRCAGVNEIWSPGAARPICLAGAAAVQVVISEESAADRALVLEWSIALRHSPFAIVAAARSQGLRQWLARHIDSGIFYL